MVAVRVGGVVGDVIRLQLQADRTGKGFQDRGQRPWHQAQLWNKLSVRRWTARLPFLLNLYLLIHRGTNNPKRTGMSGDSAAWQAPSS